MVSVVLVSLLLPLLAQLNLVSSDSFPDLDTVQSELIEAFVQAHQAHLQSESKHRALIDDDIGNKEFSTKSNKEPRRDLKHPASIKTEYHDRPDLKIYYGEDAIEGEFPFMVRLLVHTGFNNDGEVARYTMCGGSLIAPRLVLTVAHCVVDDDRSYGQYAEMVNPSNVRVITGDFSVSNENDDAEESRRAVGFIVHPDYNLETFANDIALVVLAEEIVFDDEVGPIRLPDTEDKKLYNEGAAVTVAGWGGTEDGFADELQKMEYTWSNQLLCANYWNLQDIYLAGGMICTDRMEVGDDGLAHIWGGDSGNAVFKKHDDGSFTQLALVSWATTVAGVKSYDVMTNVYYHREWINEQIQQLESLYIQKVRAQSSDETLTFDDMEKLTFRLTNIFAEPGNSVEVDIQLENLDKNHFVFIYDGDDSTSDDMIAMLRLSESMSNVLSSSDRGMTVIVMADGGGYFEGSISLTYRAVPTPSTPIEGSLTCSVGFWACKDNQYCIRQPNVCDGKNILECRDGSDETDGCDEIDELVVPDGFEHMPNATEFVWDTDSFSLEISAHLNLREYSYIELDLIAGDPSNTVNGITLSFTATKMRLEISNCMFSQSERSMDYPSSFYNGTVAIFTITINDAYLSITDSLDGTILLNFVYDEDTKDECRDYMNGISGSSVEFFHEEEERGNSFGYRLTSKPANDRLEPDPEVPPRDFSAYDSVPFVDVELNKMYLYDALDNALQIVTNVDQVGAYDRFIFDIFEQGKTREFTYFYLKFLRAGFIWGVIGCSSYRTFRTLPEADADGNHTWTFDFDRSKGQVTLLCNGLFIETFDPLQSSGYKPTCRAILTNTNVKGIYFNSYYNDPPMKIRVLCLDNCLDRNQGWWPLDTLFSEYYWNTRDSSFQWHTEMGKGSGLTNVLGFYDNEQTLENFQYMVIYHGTSHFYVWIWNCMDHFMPIRYPAAYNSQGNEFDATVTFHDQYVSILSNGELIWTFNYQSDMALETCSKIVLPDNSFMFYANGFAPSSSDRYRVVEQVSNTTEIVPDERDYLDYSEQFPDIDTVFEFKEMPYNRILQYSFSSENPLQIKTVCDIPNMGNFSIDLLNSDGDRRSSITIGAYEAAGYFYVEGCHEIEQLFAMPEHIRGTAGTRIWTIQPTAGADSLIVRCNGYEVGRVSSDDDAYLETCQNIFGDSISAVKLIGDDDHPVPVMYRILCDDDCPEQDGSPHKFKVSSVDGMPHVGMLMVEDPETEEWKHVCRTRAGGREVDAVCREMGFRTGLLVDASMTDSDPHTVSFGGSEMRCDDTKRLSGCQLTLDEESTAPCFPGDQLTVSCSDSPFEFTVHSFLVNMNRNGDRAKFKCSASASRYGEEMALKDRAKAFILQRTGTGSNGISMVTDNMKHKAKKGRWVGREYVNAGSAESCFLCVVHFGHRYNFATSGDCEADREMLMEEIVDFMTDNY